MPRHPGPVGFVTMTVVLVAIAWLVVMAHGQEKQQCDSPLVPGCVVPTPERTATRTGTSTRSGTPTRSSTATRAETRTRPATSSRTATRSATPSMTGTPTPVAADKPAPTAPGQIAGAADCRQSGCDPGRTGFVNRRGPFNGALMRVVAEWEQPLHDEVELIQPITYPGADKPTLAVLYGMPGAYNNPTKGAAHTTATRGELRSAVDGSLIAPAGQLALMSTRQGAWPAWFDWTVNGKWWSTGVTWEQGNATFSLMSPTTGRLRLTDHEKSREEWSQQAVSQRLGRLAYVLEDGWHGGTAPGLFVSSIDPYLSLSSEKWVLKQGAAWSAAATVLDGFKPCFPAVDEQNGLAVFACDFAVGNDQLAEPARSACASAPSLPQCRTDGLYAFDAVNPPKKPAAPWCMVPAKPTSAVAVRDGVAYLVSDYTTILGVDLASCSTRSAAVPGSGLTFAQDSPIVDDRRIYLRVAASTAWAQGERPLDDLWAVERATLLPDATFGDGGRIDAAILRPVEVPSYELFTNSPRVLADLGHLYVCGHDAFETYDRATGALLSSVVLDGWPEGCKRPVPVGDERVAVIQGFSWLQFMPCTEEVCASGAAPNSVDYKRCCRGHNANCGEEPGCAWDNPELYRVADAWRTAILGE